MAWQFPFHFQGQGEPDLSGLLLLESPNAYPYPSDCGMVALREGELQLENGKQVDVVLYHNSATRAFFYLTEMQLTGQLFTMLGLSTDKAVPMPTVRLPGQFVLGSRRTRLVHRIKNRGFRSKRTLLCLECSVNWGFNSSSFSLWHF